MPKQERKCVTALQIIPYTLILSFASVLLTGYYIYYHNQALQLPLVKLLNNPSLYPHDPFAATLPYYASTLWRMIALVSRYVPLEPLLWGLFLLERFVTIYAAGRLAMAFAPRSLLAAVGAMAFFALAPSPLLGGGTLVMPYLEQTGFAIPFFMLAMASFYRSKSIAWAMWLAVAFNLNSMYGTYALTYFAASFLADSKYREEWGKWARALPVFLIGSLPAILLTISAYDKQSGNAHLWVRASYIRLPHHLFPLTWHWQAYAVFGIFSLLTIGTLLQNRRDGEKLFRHGLAWAAVAFVWLCYAFAAAWARSPGMLMMQPGRGMDLWCAFGMVAFISTCANCTEDADKNRQMMMLAFLAAVLFWRAGLFTSYTILIGLLLFTLAPAWKYLFNSGEARRVAVVLWLLVLFTGKSAYDVRLQRVKEPKKAVIMHPPPSILKVTRWVRKHTSQDATFLVNPNWAMFRALSLRPAFVTWKDGSALLWYRPYASDWVERMQALGYDVYGEPPDKDVNYRLDLLYNGLTDREVKQLHQRYSIRYWVTLSDHTSAYPVVYRNSYFKVLDLEGNRKYACRRPALTSKL